MESFEEALTFLINKKNKESIQYKTGVGTVKSITGDTCVLERENLPDLFDVRLNAIIGDFEDVFMIFPSIGSEVLYLMVENASQENSIVKYSKIDKVQINIGGARFEMSSGKFDFKNKESDLKKILDKAFNRLENAIILTSSGPGKFSDPDKLVFNDCKKETQKLFK